MQDEFKRFGLEKFGFTIILLEILGAIGLLVGLKFIFIEVISSAGLTLLMFAGIIVRIMVKDKIRIFLPALILMILNGYIFWATIK